MFLAFLLLFAARVEIYEDWHPTALGSEAIDSAIHSSLEKEGFSILRWDREAHRPLLLTWKSVKTWSDFKHWLGRKTVLDSETSYLIFSNLGVYLRDLDLGKIPKEKLILFRLEPPTVQPEMWNPKIEKLFHKIYTWNDDCVDNIHFFKFHLPYSFLKIADAPPYEERKFLTLIASRLSAKHPNELYSEREKLIHFFEERPEIEFDLYGRNWGKRKFRCYKGTIPDKLTVLKQYRFAFAYENSKESGYITEKIWDCFAAGVVPIYLGAPNIENYIPSNCFIDRRKFAKHSDLLLYLEAMTKEEWDEYITNAATFVNSEAAAKFTVKSYVQVFTEAAVSKSPQLLF